MAEETVHGGAGPEDTARSPKVGTSADAAGRDPWSEVARLRRELADLRARHDRELSELRAELVELSAQPAMPNVTTTRSTADAAPEEPGGHSWTRRGLLLGGVGAAAASVAALGSATPAAAAQAAMFYGALNNAGADSTALISTAGTQTLLAENTGAGRGLLALAASSAGIQGHAETGPGVFGDSVSGTGVLAWSTSGAALGLSSLGAAPPVGGNWHTGDVLMANGEMWVCVSGGAPGSWRLLASGLSAGAFVPISPTRVYDSRVANPSGGLPILAGTDRVVSVKDARSLQTGAVTSANIVPVGTKAVVVNLTAVGLAASGYLSITAGTALTYTASAVNWSAAGQAIANSLPVPVDAGRNVKVFAPVGSSHVVIDVMGYYRAA